MQHVMEPVVVKANRKGLLVCLREDADFQAALSGLRDKLQQGASLLKDATVSLDLGWRETTEEQFKALVAVLTEQGVGLAGVLSTSLATRTLAEAQGYRAIIGRLGLAQHQGRALRQEPVPRMDEALLAMDEPVPAPPSPALSSERSRRKAVEAVPVKADPVPDRDTEDTLYLKRTLRSGQKAMYPGHIVVVGDVNPGAEIEAEGDVVVLGQLRGRVHAGCQGNNQAQVWAVGMQPTQLRIADCLWTGEVSRSRKTPAGSLKASLRGGQICIEPMSIR